MLDATTMTSLNHDDSIEIISCQTSSLHEHTFTNLQAVTPTSAGEASVSTKMLPTLKIDEKQTKKQKRIARAVMIVAGALILASFVLVGVTLSMAEHINDQVRKMNGYYSTPKPPSKPPVVTYNNTAG